MVKLEREQGILPEEVTIPRPLPESKPRGRSALKAADRPFSIRMSSNEIKTIEHAAEVFGVTRSQFIRWVTFLAANRFLSKHEALNRKRK